MKRECQTFYSISSGKSVPDDGRRVLRLGFCAVGCPPQERSDPLQGLLGQSTSKQMVLFYSTKKKTLTMFRCSHMIFILAFLLSPIQKNLQAKSLLFPLLVPSLHAVVCKNLVANKPIPVEKNFNKAAVSSYLDRDANLQPSP